MFTNCPSCARQFRVRASQLATAEGLVQCGFCGKQFNALERLYDKPLIIDRQLGTMPPEEKMDEPDFYIPEMKEEIEPAVIPEAVAAEPVVDMVVNPPATEPDPERETVADTATSALDIADNSDADYLFPEALTEQQPPQSSTASRVLWAFGAFILLLAATTQAAWFNRDILLSQYPQFLPQAKQLCQQFDCRLIRNRNISAIKLVNRDVRVHPRYEDALLVNATITNLSKYAQRFPQVLLSLFDTDGRVIAYRQIPATEYLDSSIDMEAGMRPDAPIHFVFEVANNSTDAVSFEFDFL